MFCKQSVLLGSIVVSYLAISPVHSQVILDRTTNTSVLGNCSNSCDIRGGTVAGQNLFHSFSEFNVRPGESVYFADPGVANIFGRVTGSNLSAVSGTLGVSAGDANLFLLNPNGIVFGAGAALDLSGSFFATTADEIQFGDRNFSTLPDSQENLALLTVDPSTLFFNQMGQNGSIVLNQTNLATSSGQNIALVGEQVDENPGILLQESSLQATQGNITLKSIKGKAEVELDNDLKVDFPQNVARGDLTLSQGSRLEIIDAAANSSIYLAGDSVTLTEASEIIVGNLGNFNGGAIDFQANKLSVQDNSSIVSFTNSLGKGADIKIDAQESVEVIGQDSNIFQQFLLQNLKPGNKPDVQTSRIETTTSSLGNGGNITIRTPNLRIESGARVISNTFERGTTGKIDIDVADTFSITGAGLLTAAAASTTGRVGTLDIDTDRLLIQQGGLISASTLGNGDAGNLSINAADSIAIKDTPVNSVLPTGVFTNTLLGNGRGGDLTINTRQLSLDNGAQLSASNGAFTGNGLIPLGGEGGNITINVAESLEVNGASADDKFPSAIVNDTRTFNSAGNLTINTGSLSLNQEGIISASSVSTGAGGDITINARNAISLNGNGVSNIQQLFTNALTGQLDVNNIKGGLSALSLFGGDAGNIKITTPQLNLKSGTILATATFGQGDAGNLEIAATDSINIIGSAIATPTFGQGNAGTINLTTKNLSITEGGVIASASLGTGQGGDSFITATESIDVADTIPGLFFSGSISTGSYNGLSFPGNLIIDTKRLSVRNGANIQAINTSLFPEPSKSMPVVANDSNYRGQLMINATESIEISGFDRGSQDNPYNIPANSHISSSTHTAAAASDVIINTGKLSVFNGGEIAVSSLGQGAAGTLEIVAESIDIDDQGRLQASTFSGQGGDINLDVQDILQIGDRSLINTNATGTGNGGNIDVKASFVVASENSLITANAQAMGNGGNVDITTKDLFLTPDSQITATSVLGIDGTVTIQTFANIERNNFVKLPEQVIQADNLVVQGCGNRNNQGVFTYVGRGGLPSSLLTEFFSNDGIIPDFDISNYSLSRNELEINNGKLPWSTPTIVEANTWQVNPQGKLELINSSKNSSLASNFNNFSCS